jgi:P-type Cu2+ transporter
VFFTSAWAAVRTRTPHLDVPIALALLAGGAWSVVSTIRGAGEVYFDTVSVLVFLLLVGRFVQHRQQRWAADAVELLFSITPSSARRVSRSPGGEEAIEDVPVEALRLGDVVELRAGESFPADGTVIRGDSLVDQSMLTGESAHVPISVGDPAAAGAVNIASTLRVTVEATGENTRVGRLMRLVEESSRRKAPIVRFADRVSSFFTVAMLGLAAATFMVWLSIDAPHAIEHAVALLVVTCPCALGLATPLVITIAMGRAARSGILLKGGDAMQRLSRPGRIFLDKTGTLTFGVFTLVRWIGDESVKPMAAAVESESDHPIARALARELGRGDDPLPVAIDVEQLQGVGIRGVVGDRDVRVLSPAAVRAARASDPDGLLDHEASLAAEALTPVVVVIDGRVGAIAGLGDRVRPDARAAVASLRRLGWEVSILSGDHQRVVDAVARRVGIEPDRAIGRASPEEKLEVIRRESGRGPTVMVGDGVNDSAALAAAGVGIAVHGGAEASLSAADVYLNSPGLSSIVELVESSRRTMRVIHRNLGVSVLYNATAGALAMTGHMNPLIAALVMPLSSLTVLALACRSRTFGGVS